MTAAEAASTRQRLVNAASALLDEGGYAAAPVAAIAERAGLATGALYRHFPSKAELFVEVLRAEGDRQLEEMRVAAGRHEAFEKRLEAVITSYATSALSRRRLAWALVYEPVDPLVDAERLAYRRLYRDSLAELLRQGIEAGAMPDQDVDFAAAALVGAIAEVLVGPLSPLALGSEPEAVVARVVEFCRRAVGVEAGTPAR